MYFQTLTIEKKREQREREIGIEKEVR